MFRWHFGRVALWVVLLSLATSRPLLSQDAIARQHRADELFNQSKFAEAASEYSELAKADPANAYAWYSLAQCQLSLHKYDDAIPALEKAKSLNFRPLVTNVSLAQAHAGKGDRDQVLKILEQVAASGRGGAARPIILSTAEFESMANVPQYQAILAKLLPCRTPEYRQFDFWLGNWEVRTPPGDQLAGSNDVTLEQDGCLIVEHWKASQGGQTGTSFNYYDIRDKKWHQLYIDNSGNAGAFPAMAGELKDGKMVLLTDEKVNPVSRWTWYLIKPGQVRQMAEQTSDGGKHWAVTWDSTYTKK